MKTIKVGMIGAGAIAASHIGGVQSHPQGEVVAIADLSKPRAKEMADKFGVPATLTKWEDLVANPEIDAVAIALPNFLHAPVTLAALKAGKHVILDKPFALDMKEANQVVAAAKKARKVMMVGMNQRYLQDAQIARVLVDRGELGEIYHAKAYWRRRSGCPRFGTWFGDKKLAGGGAMLDIGVHMLDLCLHTMNNWKPKRISGQVYTKFGNRGLGEGGWGKSDKKKNGVFNVDDFATALIKMSNGASVEVSISWALHQDERDKRNVELYGTEAGLAVYPAAKLFRYGKTAGEYEVVEPQNVEIPHPHCNRHYDWIEAIVNGKKPMCTLEQALAVQKIIDAIYTSSKTGKEVAVR